MTDSKVLLPLRVPELGPYLGKVVSGTGREPGGLCLDAVRVRLAGRVFEGAGEARRLASRDYRDAAAAAIGRERWLEAWEEAVGSAAGLLLDRSQARLEAEMRAVRLPGRLRRRLLPSTEDREALSARLGSAGAVLVPSLGEIERCQAAAVAATGLERQEVKAWQDALCTAGRRLEAAWLALEDAVEEEAAHWHRVAADVRGWRPAVWPILLGAAIATAGAAWLGLIMGGYVDAPSWLPGVRLMRIEGIGVDLVDVARVERMLDRFGERVLQRLLTPEERAYCVERVHPAPHVAARIAAKEAGFKALARDADARRISWTDLEVVRDAEGRPSLRLHGRARAAAERFGVTDVHVSITHERAHAAAFVVMQSS
jgi:holo-[acyl-carrier protein] synthase